MIKNRNRACKTTSAKDLAFKFDFVIVCMSFEWISTPCNSALYEFDAAPRALHSFSFAFRRMGHHVVFVVGMLFMLSLRFAMVIAFCHRNLDVKRKTKVCVHLLVLL